MKQTINIPFTFEANYTPQGIECIYNKAVEAWKSIIVDVVSARLNACKLNLFDNRERVSSVSEHTIIYFTSTGSQKHYSIVAASAMEEILECAEQNNLNSLIDSPRHLLQMIKALYWVTPEVREQKIDGYTFDDLYSYLLERLTISLKQ